MGRLWVRRLSRDLEIYRSNNETWQRNHISLQMPRPFPTKQMAVLLMQPHDLHKKQSNFLLLVAEIPAT
jgi:hypothetical protein